MTDMNDGVSTKDEETGVSQFDEPQRIAVHHEVFDDDGSPEGGEWVKEREVVKADRVDFGTNVVAFINTQTEDELLVSTDNFISAWTEDINA